MCSFIAPLSTLFHGSILTLSLCRWRDSLFRCIELGIYKLGYHTIGLDTECTHEHCLADKDIDSIRQWQGITKHVFAFGNPRKMVQLLAFAMVITS